MYGPLPVVTPPVRVFCAEATDAMARTPNTISDVGQDGILRRIGNPPGSPVENRRAEQRNEDLVIHAFSETALGKRGPCGAASWWAGSTKFCRSFRPVIQT